MFYQIAPRMTDPSLFHETGVAILTWTVNATQPTATVLTTKGAFSALLTGTPGRLREWIGIGRYLARYSGGYVEIQLGPLPLR